MNATDNIYEQIQHEVRQTVQCFGVGAGVSGDMSAAITARLQKLLGYNTIYFRGTASTAERYAAIRRDFNGVNHESVCKKYGITRRTLYRALKR